MRVKLAIVALALCLGGCASLTTPAAPRTTASPSAPETSASPSAHSPAPSAPTPDPSGRHQLANPYLGPLAKPWSLQLESKPIAVSFDPQSNTAVTAIRADHGVTVEAFSVSNTGRTLSVWTAQIPELAAVFAADSKVYVSTGSPQAPTDLVIFNARTGAEEYRWSRVNLDSARTPYLIGAYSEGAGIAQLDEDAVTAALIDERGRTVASQRFFGAPLEVSAAPNAARIRTAGGEHTFSYPELTLSAHSCWVLTDGLVCLSPSSEIFSFDRDGNRREHYGADPASAAANYELLGVNPEISTAQLAAALSAKVRFAIDGPQATPAILNAEMWIKYEDAGEPIPHQAPFALVDGAIVDISSGTTLVDSGLVATDGTSFFEWDEGRLFYLSPLG